MSVALTEQKHFNNSIIVDRGLVCHNTRTPCCTMWCQKKIIVLSAIKLLLNKIKYYEFLPPKSRRIILNVIPTSGQK